MLRRIHYEGDYYQLNSHLNNSMLALWQDDPARFWNIWINGLKEEESNIYLDWGKAVHMYILQPELFKRVYMIAEKAKPKSKNAEGFIRDVPDEHTSMDFIADMYEAYKKNYSCTSLQDEDIYKRAKELYEEMKEYRKIVKHIEKGGKIISTREYDTLTNIKFTLLDHEGIRELFNEEGENEWEYRWQMFDREDHTYAIPCKCMIDRVIWDEKNSVLKIIDIKTSTKSVREFMRNTREKKNWYIQQLTYYYIAMRHHIQKDIKDIQMYIIYIHNYRLSTTPSVYLIELDIDREREEIAIYRQVSKILNALKAKQMSHAPEYFTKKHLDFSLDCTTFVNS